MTRIARFALQDKVVEFYWDPVSQADVTAYESRLTKTFVFTVGGRGMTEPLLYGHISTQILSRYLELLKATPGSPRQFLDDTVTLPRQSAAGLLETVIPLIHQAWKPPVTK